MAETDKPPGPHVGQIVHATASGSGAAYRVTSVEPDGKGCWTYTLEPVADEQETA